MGYGGAIIAGSKGTAEEKFSTLKAVGGKTVRFFADIRLALKDKASW